jgi:hypothetical protein
MKQAIASFSGNNKDFKRYLLDMRIWLLWIREATGEQKVANH